MPSVKGPRHTDIITENSIQTVKYSNIPLHIGSRSKKDSTCCSVTLDGEGIPNVTDTTHLDIDRNMGSKGDVKKKVHLGRRTMYTLMGAGA